MKMTSVFLTILFFSALSWSQTQKYSAICSVEQKTVRSLAPNPESKVIQENTMAGILRNVKQISLYNHTRFNTWATLVNDLTYIRFNDTPTTVEIVSNRNDSIASNFKTSQSTRFFNQRGTKQLIRHDDLNGSPHLVRYSNNYRAMSAVQNPGTITQLTLTVDELRFQGKTRGVRATIYISSGNEADGAAMAELSCANSEGTRFTYSSSLRK